MRWRQVLVLYLVAGALAVAYVRLAPRAEGPSDGDAHRRPRVLALDAATVNELAIDHAGRHVVARRDGDAWVVEEPPGASVPSDLVKAFVAAVLDAEEIERVPTDPDLTAFGLDDRATRIELRPAGGPPETLWLGAGNPAGTAVYARRLGDRDVLLVGRTLRYYEELILQALPSPHVPAHTDGGPVALRERPTSRPPVRRHAAWLRSIRTT